MYVDYVFTKTYCSHNIDDIMFEKYGKIEIGLYCTSPVNYVGSQFLHNM